MFKFFITSFYCVLFYLASLFVGHYVHALEVNDLYQARVNVDSQGAEHRKRALKKAMQAVMLKVGGESSVIDNAVLKKALTTANLFMTQFYYEQTEQLSTNKKKPGYNLVAQFDEGKINKLFTQANLPIWGSLRPQILLWLIDEQGLSRRIISNASISNPMKLDFPNLVTNFSQQRGLPIIMPLMDFDDSKQITLSDLWGRFEDPIYTASARYSPDAIVVMRISNSSLITPHEFSDINSALRHSINYNQAAVKKNSSTDKCGLLCSQGTNPYSLDWRLLPLKMITNNQGSSDQQRFSQRYQGMNEKKLLQQGLADISEVIYQQYALSTERNNSIIIEVANIDTLTEYTELVDFLTALSAIRSVTLISAKASMRRFNLQLLGSTDTFLASLKLNKQLQQQPIDPLSQIDKAKMPIFNWEP